MANSKYEYVKSFEQNVMLLPNTYLVVRIDGRRFHTLCTVYDFEKPNDRRALDLMNAAAQGVMRELPEISLAYGLSDEFSFVLGRSCNIFDRRESKILTTVVSTFTSWYIHSWQSHFPEKPLDNVLPSFDGRVMQYPTPENIRDYLSWRQVDCHINNLYNTTFWALQQQGGMNAAQAEEELKGTLASQKHEILFSRFNINYNNELEIYRKGSVLYREHLAKPNSENKPAASKTQKEKYPKRLVAAKIVVDHTDIIKHTFWEGKPWLLSSKEALS